MYYQIYDTRHNTVLATYPSHEDAYNFLRLYEAGERALHRSEECSDAKPTLISVTIPSNASVQNCPRAEK